MAHKTGPLHVKFEELAKIDEEFGAEYRRNGNRMDFCNPELQRLLTKATLKQRFDTSIHLPDNRLCPAIPGRWEYVDFLLGLIDSTPENAGDLGSGTERNVIGIDIGCGASCIYPLLGCAVRPNWRFGATEIDDESFKYAMSNVQINKLQARIRLVKIDDGDGKLLNLDKLRVDRADFTMCNPPFYTSATEMQQSLAEKERPPSAICTGAPTELVTHGGDIGFALRIHKESLQLKDRVQWFTCLLGRLESVGVLVQAIKDNGTDNFAVARLDTGGKTRRWVVAWSFMGIRPDIAVIRGKRSIDAFQPPATAAVVDGVKVDTEHVGELLQEIVAKLDAQWAWHAARSRGFFRADKDVWSRKARRERAKLLDAGGAPSSKHTSVDMNDESHHDLVVIVDFLPTAEQMSLRWFKGDDFALFQSFAGMLRRALIHGRQT